MKKLRWAMDGGFWDLDVSTPMTMEGTAGAVGGAGEVVPLGVSRGVKLSRPKQLDFMHRFMSMPLVPSYSAAAHGFSLQRALSFSFADNWFAAVVGQFRLQKFISSLKECSSRHPHESPWIKKILTRLCDKSLYALGFCSEFLVGEDYSVLLTSEAYGAKMGARNKAIFYQKLPQHNLTLEAMWPGLFVDTTGTYWDVPLSIAVDLASVSSNSESSYHLCIHNNNGHPKQFTGDDTGRVPPDLLPGLCVKAAFSIKKDADIWRNKESKLRMVQPFDIFMSDPHVSASGVIGTVVSACFGDNSVKPPKEYDSLGFKALNLLARGNRSSLFVDLFGSISCSAQYGNFQRLFFDLTRLNACLDFPSGMKLITGAASVGHSLCSSQQPDLEAVNAIFPYVTLSLQQQIVGPMSLRFDSRISLDATSNDYFARVHDPVFAMEYALKVLGSAKAVAWYSPKQKEAMVELRFFES